MSYTRGTVVKGPDLFGPHEYRPLICLSDDSHPFSDGEALYAAATTIRRSVAIALTDEDFPTGGPPQDSYVNPWTVTSIRHADVHAEEGQLTPETTETVVRQAAAYLGVM